MDSGYTEVAVLPVVVTVSVVAFAVLAWLLHRRAALTVLRAAVAAVLAVYVAGVVGNTLFPVYLGKGSDLPWWGYPELTPLAGYEVSDLVTNIVLFLPLGVLLPLVARVGSAGRVLLYGFLTSLTMELLQWLNAATLRGGHVPDVNDLLANTLGAPLGYGLFRLALLVPPLARLAAAATWPTPRVGAAERSAVPNA